MSRPLPQAGPPEPSGPTSASFSGLVAFELREGSWVALAVLRRELGWLRFLRLLASYSWRGLRNPFRGLPRASSRRERLSRHQLKPVLILDEALRRGLGLSPERSQELLLAAVGASGARFLRRTLELPGFAEWQGLAPEARTAQVQGLLPRFFNMLPRLRRADAAGVEFAVEACHFARLCRELGREELAPLFCAADSVFFEDPSVGIALERPSTLAAGGSECLFRLSYREGEATPRSPA